MNLRECVIECMYLENLQNKHLKHLFLKKKKRRRRRKKNHPKHFTEKPISPTILSRETGSTVYRCCWQYSFFIMNQPAPYMSWFLCFLLPCLITNQHCTSNNFFWMWCAHTYTEMCQRSCLYTVNYWTKKPLDKYHMTPLTMQHIADSTYWNVQNK